MLGLADSVKQTRVYQEGIEEGREKEAETLVLRLLKRQVGELSPALKAQTKALPVERLEDLGEALLDFKGMDNLVNWLQANTIY